MTNKPASHLDLRRTSELSADVLSETARAAAEEILIAGEAPNTRRAYQSALRYWCAWFAARYGRKLPLPVPAPVVVQFVVDHVAREGAGRLVCELPKAIDATLVAAGAKGHPGALTMSTVRHRLSVLSKLHQLRRLAPNPCEDPQVRHLVSRARRAGARRGEAPRRKTAATREPLAAMLATCDESLAGKRDRALLLFAWATGGRRRSEVTAARVEHVHEVDAETLVYRLTHSKTQQSGATTQAVHVDKPIVGDAAHALRAWLTAAQITEGPLFRRVWRTRVGPGLTPSAVARIVRRRAVRAGLDGDWAGHSLRAGYVTEAGRQGIPLGDVMALTGHAHVTSVMGYYRSGEMTRSRAARLFTPQLAPENGRA